MEVTESSALPATFLFLCALVHPFPCCLETAREKLREAVTPLPQICERAANEEMWVQEAIRPRLRENIHSLLASRWRGEAGQTGERPSTQPAAELLSTRQECVHTSRPTTSQRCGKHAPRPNPNRVCVLVRASLLWSTFWWRCVNIAEGVLGARVMDDLILRGTERGMGGVRKGSSVIRIFLSLIYVKYFKAWRSYISCC